MNIFVVAGDLSGDIHAANLVRALKKKNPSVFVRAIGGVNLQAAADEFLENIVGLSAFGFWAPVRLYLRLRRIFSDKIKKLFLSDRPDKVVLVDYYGFNIHVAGLARQLGIPVYYYVSPQVWASRSGRIRKLAACVKKMLVILPFEEEIYRKAGVDAVFVGNPLLDTFSDIPESKAPGLPQVPLIGLFPGSRPSVAAIHVRLMEDAARIIMKQLRCEFKFFGLSSERSALSNVSIPVVYDAGLEERAKLTAAITVSGTVSLENALFGIPMIVVYRLSMLNYWLARMLVKVKYITMVNILAGRKLVPELIQKDASPEKIAAETVKLLSNAEEYSKMRSELLSVRKLLGKPGAGTRAAEIIIND